MSDCENIDRATVKGFGEEWRYFNQAALSDGEKKRLFDDYFHIFPWNILQEKDSVGADLGCGTGRWASLVAPRVKTLHLIDASEDTLQVAKNNLHYLSNLSYHHSSIDEMPLPDNSLDFAYCLGVLHHVPDIESAVAQISRKLRRGAPFLSYLYYAFDNRPFWFRWLWHLHNVARGIIWRMPFPLRLFFSQVIAFTVYLPVSRAALIADRLGCLPPSWPLAYYRDKSLYVMRTDSLDRFGTKLEKRYSRAQIKDILEKAGFADIRFSEKPPYWCSVCIKK